MTMFMDPLRRITAAHPYTTSSHPKGTVSYTLVLECGHEVHCKGSKRPKRRARCYLCATIIGRVYS